MPCGVTNRIWVNLGCTEVGKETAWETPSNHRAGPGVMSMVNPVRTVLAGRVG